MLIPINTDAPIYHWPWATLGLIIANVFTFALTGWGDHESAAFPIFLLHYGQGLHPLQWVLCNFLHLGWLHLIGNMIFLWGFGIIVEGKLGWLRYLAVYLGIGIVHSAMLQIAMLGANGGGSGGASGVIFGLLAMSVVWAPKNELTCILIILYRGIIFDISILTFSIYYIGMQLFTILFLAALTGSVMMSSEMIHIVGAVTGFIVAFVMLKMDWVDCENWDLLAVMRGTYGNQVEPDDYQYRKKAKTKVKKKQTDELPVMLGDDQDPLDEFARAEKKIAHKTKSIRKLRELLKQGRAAAALAEYQRLKNLVGGMRLDYPELKALANGLYKAKNWSQGVPLMQEYIERFPEEAVLMRLKLAGVMVKVQKRPRSALKLIESISEPLSDELELRRRKVIQRAEKMIDEGVIEIDGGAW